MVKERIAIVGAAESTELGKLPNISQVQLHADAALNALNDCGLSLKDIDGIATAGHDPTEIAQYLNIIPTWVDGTAVGGCSFIIHVRHAVAALMAGYCNNVLITHGESGRHRIGATNPIQPSQALMQFEIPYGVTSAATKFTLPILRYMKDFSLSIEKLAMVPVVQRQWASYHPRATFRDLISVDDVLSSRMIAYPFTLLMCCLRTDGGGALILSKSNQSKDLKQRPVYIMGSGEAVESPTISQMRDFTTSEAFRVSSKNAFVSAGINHNDVDHLMIYDAFAHLPIYGLEDMGFVGRGEAADFIADGHTSVGGNLPVNTNGGGLSYMHSGMYSMYALQESIRQLRGTSPAQVDKVDISVVHGVGGSFSSAATIVLSHI